MEKFMNLDQLLASSADLRAYMASLPGYAQESIRERADSIHTHKDLYTYGENLMAGDD